MNPIEKGAAPGNTGGSSLFRCVFWVAQLKILPSSQSRKLEEAEGPRIFMSREIRQAIREILLCIRSGSLGRKTAP